MKPVGIRKKGSSYEVTYKNGTKELVGKRSGERIKMQVAAERQNQPSAGKKLKAKTGTGSKPKPRLKK